MTTTRPRVTVIGGGVIGLTTALALSGRYDVHVVAERVGISTDSRKATAIWHVYLVPETPTILAWSAKTLERLCELAADSLTGVELVRGVELFRRTQQAVPVWASIPRLFRMLEPSEIDLYNSQHDLGYLSDRERLALLASPVTWGYEIEAPAASMDRYLPWLQQQVTQAGIRFTHKRIQAFAEAAPGSDVIVNCSGFGARELAGDHDFVPYKGQYFVLRATSSSPGMYIGDDDHPGGMAYMIPRAGEVMVGGCAEQGVDDLALTLDWQDTIRRSALFVPWLRNCTADDQARSPVVCIRPARGSGVRLEIDQPAGSIPVVHNYGHGGSGFSLSWGCADAVLQLLDTLF